MKKIFLLGLLCASLNNYAQQWVNKINDPDYKNRLVHGLKIGDKMPDLPLGTVLNNNTGKTKFSGFKGKLIILDFWNTYCSTCIENFPHMAALQKEFGDKIQIILITPNETAEKVMNFFKGQKKYSFPNLLCIVLDSTNAAKDIGKLFPRRELGHQVWIDANGFIKLRGASQNNTRENIKNLLDNKSFFILNDLATAPIVDVDFPYYKLLGDFANTPLKYGSFFTPFNNEYNPATNATVLNKIDSITRTKRNSYVNVRVLDLFYGVFKSKILNSLAQILYGPGPDSRANGVSNFVLPKDTTRYATAASVNAQEFIKDKVCYEQVVPIDLPEERRKLYMLQDLNRYFGSLYETEAKLERRIVPCYILVRTSDQDKIASKVKGYYNYKTQIVNGKTVVEYKNTQLLGLGDLIKSSPDLVSLFIQNSKNGGPSLLLNETGFSVDKSIDLVLPEGKDIKTIEDLRKILKPYDIDIELVQREIPFVVITDNSGKSI